MTDIRQLLAALDGAHIPGGCDHCNAYQERWIDAHGMCHITIRHDNHCPYLQAMESKADHPRSKQHDVN